MTSTNALVVWSPRILGILVALVLGIFALDAFQEGQSLRDGLFAFLMHLLPTFVLLAAVAVSWRREWLGAAVFLVGAVLYSSIAQRLDWILVVAGPLLLVGVLFLISWRARAPRT